MKVNPFILSIFTLTVFISCEKPSNISPQEDTYLMTVKEYKTYIPLADVNINFYGCTDYDIEFGCQSKSVFATPSTNQNGEYTFTQGLLNQSNQGIILSKSQYWDIQGGVGEVFMEPEAFVNLTLKASKAYPETSLFQLKTTGALGIASFETFITPKDSTFNYRLFANEKNTINWIVYTKDLGCYQYCILDTIARGSLILNSQKFEILNAAIDY